MRCIEQNLRNFHIMALTKNEVVSPSDSNNNNHHSPSSNDSNNNHKISSNLNHLHSYISFLPNIFHSYASINLPFTDSLNSNLIHLINNPTILQNPSIDHPSLPSHLKMQSHLGKSSSQFTSLDSSKAVGNFESSVVNSRNNSVLKNDIRNNNPDSFTDYYRCISSNINMTSNLENQEARVPANGETTTAAATAPITGSRKGKELLSRTTSLSGKAPSSNLSRKNSLASNSSVKYKDFGYGDEPWKDDSLSPFSSSISSSMSSLPSIPTPPSPASPPSYRPQSTPQQVHPRGEGLSCDIPPSLPESCASSYTPEVFTSFTTKSEGSDAPRKRIKDKDGFIRRAACVCVNREETEVLLVSSKSSSEVWLVPGGGLEAGEEPQEAAIREAYEEAGVKGSVLGYLGLFESGSDASASGKKHRTAVYVIRVDQEEMDFPERNSLGRQTKWMSLDDALSQLSRNRPRQVVYLQLLRANRMNTSTRTSVESPPPLPETSLSNAMANACQISSEKSTRNASPSFEFGNGRPGFARPKAREVSVHPTKLSSPHLNRLPMDTYHALINH